MRRSNLLTIVGIVLLGSALASAQATRTWVSGVGDDANPCSRTAPCKTFAGAISKTAPGGEIDALDPGGFGALTITKSITLDGGGGQVASVLVAGTNGIVVAAGASDVVIIRNLRLDGLLGSGNANAGINGIRFISGLFLSIENCDIFGFNNNGIDIALGASGKVEIKNTTVTNNANAGIAATTSSGQVQVSISDSYATFNQGANGGGIVAGDHSRVSVINSIMSDSNNGLRATASAGDSIVTCDHCNISHNGQGVVVGGGAASFVADSTVAFNSVAFSVAAGGGQNNSYLNNRIQNNGSDGTFSTASPGLR
ncbi:MAG TPA: right-handed parallel beta-helix repeat-containing protein [Candidatus Angelobacter sp.]|nr:right-handed parallel beta-helix repeat-containing protein [Candidatus Angelobacter sp.]